MLRFFEYTRAMRAPLVFHWIIPCIVSGLLLAAPRLWGQEGDASIAAAWAQKGPFPGTERLEETTPLSDRILEGSKQFLLDQWEEARQQRRQRWSHILSLGDEPLAETRQALRERLMEITGSHDQRVVATHPTVIESLDGSNLASGGTPGEVPIRALQWEVLEGSTARGFWMGHREGRSGHLVIVIPDGDVALHDLLGPVPETRSRSAAATRALACELWSSGADVVVMQTIGRTAEKRRGRVELTDQEYVYRMTAVLGRHPVGLDILNLRALIDGWEAVRGDALGPDAAPQSPAGSSTGVRVGVVGHGDGGLVALLAAAIDPRIEVTMASGIWGNWEDLWRQPIGRNLFGLMSEFGEGGVVAMIAPRKVILERAWGQPLLVDAPGAAPGHWQVPTATEVRTAQRELQQWFQPKSQGDATVATAEVVMSLDAAGSVGPLGSRAGVAKLLASLGGAEVASKQDPALLAASLERAVLPWTPESLRRWQLNQIERMVDIWVHTSRREREAWVQQLDTSSLENYAASIRPQRERFYQVVLGRFDLPRLPPRVRSRPWKETPQWLGYEVEMDVFPQLVAGGIMLVPRDARRDAPRPAVVCVHGLEGRPEDTIENDHPAYHDFAARLCERGYIVFCPQQLYLGHDRFRVLQRIANPIGKTLFSLIIPQHQQILGFLKECPLVDPQRIGFYGLSYGGKSAMRIPSVLEDYAVAICSADYNEWVLKNVSPRDDFSYVWTPEYEIFEFNLGRTFNYAEMAALVCPRPFMVERGHFDGVGIDRWVAFEYAPVRFLYAAKLGIPERTEIEWFAGPHTIHGKGTFRFLDRHLGWGEQR